MRLMILNLKWEREGACHTFKPSKPHCLYVRDCFLGLITIAQSTETYTVSQKEKSNVNNWMWYYKQYNIVILWLKE